MRAAVLAVLLLPAIMPFSGLAGQSAPGASPAQPNGAEAAAMGRIALAGRLAMLVEQIGKAACFSLTGLEPQRHLALAVGAGAEFDRVRARLALGTSPRSAALAQGLARIGGSWPDTAAPLDAAEAQGVIGEVELAAIAAARPALLAEIEVAMRLLQRAEARAVRNMGRAIAMEIAARQRMLAQRMMRQVCQIARGEEVEAERKALGRSAALFSGSLAALMEGAPDVGIRPPRTPELARQLAVVAELWAPLAPIFASIVGRDAAFSVQSHAGLLVVVLPRCRITRYRT